MIPRLLATSTAILPAFRVPFSIGLSGSHKLAQLAQAGGPLSEEKPTEQQRYFLWMINAITCRRGSSSLSPVVIRIAKSDLGLSVILDGIWNGASDGSRKIWFLWGLFDRIVKMPPVWVRSRSVPGAVPQ